MMEKKYVGVNFTGANFSGENFIGDNLTGANFYFTDLHGADFTGADLTGAILTGANLYRAIFTNAIFESDYLATTKLGTATVHPFNKKGRRKSYLIADDLGNRIVVCGSWVSTLADFEVRCNEEYPDEPEEAYFEQIKHLKTI